MVLRPGKRAVKAAGAVVGLGVFAWLLLQAAKYPGLQSTPREAGAKPELFFVIFSLIAIASAVRMITHHRPVYSALYFIMVVLSSAALFLLLEAEFMAFALVIVYAGAILITYMFVLMLAQQAPDAEHPGAQPEYDVIPREPAAAVLVGFIMLAVFTNMVFGGVAQLTPTHRLSLMPGALQAAVQEVSPGSRIVSSDVQVIDGQVIATALEPGLLHETLLTLPETVLPSNVQAVGFDLVWKFPVSLELAGVILLMAMFGAVVLARKQIELGEDEVREAAGMRRLAFHTDDLPDHSPSSGGVGGER